jgi:hypothetical protein
VPFQYRIDPQRKLVVAWGTGTVTDPDVFAYQREVWSKPEVAGYHELIDMSEVKAIEMPSIDRMWELAAVSTAMDRARPSGKLAIVAPRDMAFGLGRMYERYRALESRGNKQVGVFRTLDEALAYLGVEGWFDMRENA